MQADSGLPVVCPHPWLEPRARPCRGCGQRACPECISDHICRACRSSNQSCKENNPDVNDPDHQPLGSPGSPSAAKARYDEADADIRPPVEAAAGSRTAGWVCGVHCAMAAGLTNFLCCAYASLM